MLEFLSGTLIERMGGLQDAAMAEYGPAFANVGAAQLRFYDQQDQRIKSWDLLKSLTEEYFEDDGLYVAIKTEPSIIAAYNTIGVYCYARTFICTRF